GSLSQVKAYVTGLEAAYLVVDYLKQCNPSEILPVEADEPHIQVARAVNKTVRDLGNSILPDFWLP
ncbi:MAG: amine oxidase, partial [Tolypothrix sp. T3-bin4]|nr:amine oxidase [Tolypothrix sp. T3-bin4]